MIDNTVTLPRTYLRHYYSEENEKKLINRVLTYSAAKKKLTPHLVARLTWHPHLLASAILSDDIDLDVQRTVCADPYVAYLAMMDRYAPLAPVIEPHFIRTAPPAIAMLLKNCRAYPKRLLLSEPEYLAILTEKDPARRLWFAEKEQFPALLAEFAKNSQHDAPVTAPWAYLRLMMTRVTEIPAALSTVIERDEEFIYRTAFLMANRKKAGNASADYLPMVAKLTSPRWIFHVLRDNLVPAGELRDHLLKALKACPAWCVELISMPIWNENGEMHGGTSPLPIPVLEGLYLDMIKFGHAHPTMDDAHMWVRQMLMPEQAKLVRMMKNSVLAAA